MQNILEIKINDTTPPERDDPAAASSRYYPEPPRTDGLNFRQFTPPPLMRDLVPVPPKTLQEQQDKFDAKTTEAEQLTSLASSRFGLPPQLSKLLFDAIKPQGPSPMEVARQQAELQRELIREAKLTNQQAKAIADELKNPKPQPKPDLSGFDFSPKAATKPDAAPASMAERLDLIPKKPPAEAPAKPQKRPEAFDFTPEVPKAKASNGFDFSPDAPSTEPAKPDLGGFDLSPDAPSTAPTKPVGSPDPAFDFRTGNQLPVAKPAAPPPVAPVPTNAAPKIAPVPTAGAGAGAAGGATGAAGAAGAAALGPVGIAIMAAEKIEEGINKMYANTEKGIRGLGNAATAIAGNDGLGLMKQATGAATEAIESIPVVGKDLVRNWKIMIAGQEAYTQTILALTRRGQELAEYDSRLALASAEVEVAKIRADLREANRTGESVSRLMKAQSRIETSTQDGFSRVKDVMAQVLAPSLERLATMLERFEPIFNKQMDVLEALGEVNDQVQAVLNRFMDALPQIFPRVPGDAASTNEAQALFEGLLSRLNDLDLGQPKQKLKDAVWQEAISGPLRPS